MKHIFSLFVLVDGGEKATEDGGEGDKEKSGGDEDPFAASADAPANNGGDNGASNNAEPSAGANNRKLTNFIFKHPNKNTIFTIKNYFLLLTKFSQALFLDAFWQ